MKYKMIHICFFITLITILIAGCAKSNNSLSEILETQTAAETVEIIEESQTETTSEILQNSVVEVAEPTSEVPSEVDSDYEITDISTTMYAATSLNVRSGPDTNYGKIGSLTINQEVTITGQVDNGWYRINFNGNDAYVSNLYLNSEKSEKNVVQTDDLVANLNIAQSTNQIIIVAASGSSATVSMHNKNEDGLWQEILTSSADIGRNGIGKTSEGDGKTPKGIYGFSFAFGIQPDPETSLSYTQVDDSNYWVDDVNSIHYNKFVSTNSVIPDWESAEHITSAGKSYHYVLAINYNSSCTPGAGSAIFMHCPPTSGAGCIAIPESTMILILQNVQPGCVLVIDNTSDICNY